MPAPKNPNTIAANEARRRKPYTRVNVNIDSEVLARVDAKADNRSRAIEEALKLWLKAT